jgi:paraquat-inducible protein B
VGVVEDVQLASDATHVNVYAVVWRRYANLVHSNSRFWKVTGAEIKGGVLTGLDVKLGSIRSMMVGGVTFATPDKDMGVSAREGDQFILHDTAKSDWLNWAPKMRLEAKD